MPNPASRQQHVAKVSKIRMSCAGMFVGASLVGLHMAMTHGVTLAMVASYIPTNEVPGIGRVSGTCWSFTDFIFGNPLFSCQANADLRKYLWQLPSLGMQVLCLYYR